MKATDFEKVMIMKRYNMAGEEIMDDFATVSINFREGGYDAIWKYCREQKVYKTKEDAIKAMIRKGYVLSKRQNNR